MEAPGTATRSGAGALRFLVEETAWIVLVAFPWILAVAFGWVRTGLFGLHAAVLVYDLVRERGEVPGWLALRFRDVVLGALAGGGILLIGAGYGLGLRALGIELRRSGRRRKRRSGGSSGSGGNPGRRRACPGGWGPGP